MADEDLDEPLGTEVKASIEELWKLKHDFMIPPSWHGTDTLVGRFHRQFIRRSMTLFLFQGLQTPDSASSLGQQGKKARLG